MARLGNWVIPNMEIGVGPGVGQPGQPSTNPSPGPLANPEGKPDQPPQPQGGPYNPFTGGPQR
jgi:hypothetical protein